MEGDGHRHLLVLMGHLWCFVSMLDRSHLHRARQPVRESPEAVPLPPPRARFRTRSIHQSATSPPPPHVCMCARVACSQHVTSHVCGRFFFLAECGRKERRGELEGVKICVDAPSVNHLLFADDSLLLQKINGRSAHHLQNILDLYEICPRNTWGALFIWVGRNKKLLHI